MIETTQDGILNNRLTIEQPAHGFRIAIDTIFLAAAVPAQAGEAVLDLGCGVGGGLLALTARVQGLAVTGVEIQPELAALCQKNIDRNAGRLAAGNSFSVHSGDLTALPPHFAGAFNHVMMNPPYHLQEGHDASPKPCKRVANLESGEGALAQWLDAARWALKGEGQLTLIHRADRLDEILDHLQKASWGAVSTVFLLPKKESPPKRVLVVAQRDGVWSRSVGEGFVLHLETGGFTTEAELILRHKQNFPMIDSTNAQNIFSS